MKKIIFSLLLVCLMFFNLSPVLAEGADPYGLEATAGEVDKGGTKFTRNTDIPTTIGNIVSVALSFIGILFLILIIYAGFLWMTAGGDHTKVETSIKYITNGVIGLVIVGGAYLIVRFVGEAIIGQFTQ